MSKRPVGLGPILLFENRAKPDLPRSLGVNRDGRAERPPGHIVLDADVGRGDFSISPILAPRLEIVCGPVARGCEIPFAIRLGAVDAHERLETGGLPQL